MSELAKSIALAIFVLGLWSSYGLAQQDVGEKPMSVSICELLGNMQKWNGRLVEVRGRERRGILYLWDVCPTTIAVKGHSFQNVIALAKPMPGHRWWTVHQIPFQIDDPSWLRFISASYQVPGGRSLALTAVGLFETRLDDEQLVRKDGVPMGFGDQNLAPAQLVVKEIRDLEFVP